MRRDMQGSDSKRQDSATCIRDGWVVGIALCATAVKCLRIRLGQRGIGTKPIDKVRIGDKGHSERDQIHLAFVRALGGKLQGICVVRHVCSVKCPPQLLKIEAGIYVPRAVRLPFDYMKVDRLE